MSHLVEVAFKGNRKEFFLWEADDVPAAKAAVIVEADRGEDLGRVHATGDLAKLRAGGCTHGLAGAEATRRVLRLATDEDVRRQAELRAQDDGARRKAAERVKANGLLMKLTDAEWQWDRKKLTFYFTAEKRVDFRQLVRDLAALFRTRIELKQIGVRDEARRLDGIGRCGRQYCSASWLPELRPVNLGVAKDQRLSLNPSQISGACGRLMCCLRYEHEFYVQSRKRFPKEGKILATSKGEEKVVANDIFRERVTLRTVEGETRVVSLADLRREMAPGGGVELAEPPEPETEQADSGEEGELGEGTAPRRAQRPRGRPLPTLDRNRGRTEAPRAERAPTPAPVSAPPEATPETTPAALPAAPAEATLPGDDVAAADASSPGAMPDAAGDGERRRRRRGRRGGRRGRGDRNSPANGQPQGGAEAEPHDDD